MVVGPGRDPTVPSRDPDPSLPSRHQPRLNRSSVVGATTPGNYNRLSRPGRDVGVKDPLIDVPPETRGPEDGTLPHTSETKRLGPEPVRK